MAFDYIVCTEKLFQELGLPESMRTLEGDVGNVVSLVGSNIFYDSGIPAALIREPECPRTGGPGIFYTLALGRRRFRVQLVIRLNPEHTNVTAWIDDGNEDIDLDLLKTALHAAFTSLLGNDIQVELSLPKRHDRPRIQRPYKELIAKLNAAAENPAMTLGGSAMWLEPALLQKNLPIYLFLFSVLPDELEGFLAYGQRVSWEGALPKTRKLIDDFLEADPKDVKRIFR